LINEQIVFFWTLISMTIFTNYSIINYRIPLLYQIRNCITLISEFQNVIFCNIPGTSMFGNTSCVNIVYQNKGLTVYYFLSIKSILCDFYEERTIWKYENTLYGCKKSYCFVDYIWSIFFFQLSESNKQTLNYVIKIWCLARFLSELRCSW